MAGMRSRKTKKEKKRRGIKCPCAAVNVVRSDDDQIHVDPEKHHTLFKDMKLERCARCQQAFVPFVGCGDAWSELGGAGDDGDPCGTGDGGRPGVHPELCERDEVGVRHARERREQHLGAYAVH